MKAGKYKLQHAYSLDDSSEWWDELEMTVTEQGEKHIAAAMAYMAANPIVRAVKLDVNQIADEKAGIDIKYPGGRFAGDGSLFVGTEYLNVCPDGSAYLIIQSKWNCADMAEYDVKNAIMRQRPTP